MRAQTSDIRHQTLVGRRRPARWLTLFTWARRGVVDGRVSSVALGTAALCLGFPSVAYAGWIDDLLKHQASWIWFLAAFLGGLALNLTPCVYPMIPVTLAFFSAQKSGQVRSTLKLAGCYVLGMSLTYATLGFIVAKTGALLGAWLQQPIALIGIAALMVFLALSMFGLYELQAPAWLLARFGQASTGSLGALVMGLTLGLIAAPCIGPFVLGLLLTVSELGQPVVGFALLFTMGLGMGLPYVLLGLLASRTARLPKAGAWLVWVKKLLGVVLLGLAVHFLRPLLADGVFHWTCMVGLVGAGIYLGWLERSAADSPPAHHRVFAWIRRGTGLAMIAASLAFVPRPAAHSAGLIAWQPYHADRLAQATQAHRPAIVDVSADWCLPCLELERVTFRHPDVARQLSTMITLRIDATKDVPPEAQALLDRYEIFGVPTVLMFDAAGHERPELRVTGFLGPKEFLARLSTLTHLPETPNAMAAPASPSLPSRK